MLTLRNLLDDFIVANKVLVAIDGVLIAAAMNKEEKVSN